MSLVTSDSKVTDRPSVVILTQFRLIDTKRLQYKIGDITEEEFAKIKEALVALLK